MKLPEINEWQIRDSDGLIMPYYTHSSLEWIKANTPKGVTVLEIGGGYSTLWWRKNALSAYTIEGDKELAEQIDCKYCTPEEIIPELNSLDKFDVVISDGGGDREIYLKEAFAKCKKYFILDNFQQEEVCIYSDESVKFLYEKSKEQLIFKQHNHPHWKTAIFIL